VNSVLQDIRFGARILLRSPGITAAVIFALALGIGANSAMFSVVDALLLHPLRYQDPSKLVILWDLDPKGPVSGCSAPNFFEWRKAKALSDVAAWVATSFVVSGLAEPAQVSGARTTANFFRTLGVKPVLGRTFLPGEDGLDGGPGGSSAVSHVAVIGYQMWQGMLGGDPNVLGRTIVLNQTPYAVVGVMPPDFEFLNRRHQVWVLAVLDSTDRDYRYLTVVGRRTVPLETAGAEMAALSRSLEQAYPASNKGWAIRVDDFQEFLVNRRFRTRLLLLFSAVGLVLLLACTNVASLLFARSAARNREIGVRIALGATSGRLIRQLLTESILLALAGGAVGLGLADLLIRAAPGFVPANAIPTTAPIELNPLVLLFTVGVSLFTGILFGLAPALSLSRTDVRGTLNDASRGSTSGRARQRFRQAMVTIEVAVALVLLASAGLMTESLRRLAGINLGFDPENVLTLRVFLPVARYNAAQAMRFHSAAMDKIAALPGVQSVAMASNLPLNRLTMGVGFEFEGSAPRPLSARPESGYTTITPDYLRTLGIPLKRGRNFIAADNQNAPPVVMINEAFAERFFPGQDPVGRRILLNLPALGKNGFADEIKAQIVGLTGNVALGSLDASPDPVLYAPLAQNTWSPVTWLAVKLRTNPSRLLAAVRNEVSSLDGELPVDQAGTLEQTFFDQLAEPRFQSRLMIAFAGLALVLAVVGIYGVNAYAVTQRRREIGVRVALGATPGDVLRDAIGRGMRLTALGIAAGLAGAAALNSVLRSVLVDVSATDPVLLLAAAGILALVAAVACYIPARRATRIDPAAALRGD
jgi:putative ABC transport system permease protein